MATSGSRQKIAVIIVENSRFIRALVRDVLSLDPDIEVVAEAADGEEAVKLSKSHAPNVVVIDTEMGDSGEINATKALKTLRPSPKIIVFSANNDRVASERAYAAGADDFLVKDKTALLAGRIRAVCGKGGAALGDPGGGSQQRDE